MAVTGIGGVIFRAKDPEAQAAWYKKYLGIDRNKWEQQAGATAFAPMAMDSDMFGSKSQMFMLNFRVDDLEAMLRQLKAGKVKIVKSIEKYDGMGSFAAIEDPEGNRIELWEPSD